MKQAEPFGSLLKQLLGHQGLAHQLTRYQAWLIWDKLVGEQIARRARPLRLRQNVLEVQVDHPVWMQQLQMLKPKILEKLQQKIPNAGITDIYLRKSSTALHRPTESAPQSGPPPWKQQSLTQQELEQIDHQLAEITDTELRAEMKRLFCLQARLNKQRQA